MPLNYTTNLGPLEGLKNQLAFSVRVGMFDTFMRECQPRRHDRVADFGVSGQRANKVHYFFEMLYPYTSNVTAIGRETEDARWFPEQFPGLTFVEADLRRIPLPDNYFAAGICNAVLEHAGTRESQAALVAEVCRVCRNVLFTTPNKSFPLEMHTFLPLVHWLPDACFRSLLRRLGYGSLADVESLNLLDERALRSLFPRGRETYIRTAGLPLVKTNLLAISRQPVWSIAVQSGMGGAPTSANTGI